MLKSDRIITLDFIRGIGLIFIFILNSYAMLLDLGFSSALTTYEQLIFSWLDMTITNTSYTLFAMLFGMGIALIEQKYTQRQEPVLWILYRRMLFLALIGFIHYQFIWQGDILFIYALIGLLVMILRKLPMIYLFIFAISFHLTYTIVQIILHHPGLQQGQLFEWAQDYHTIISLLNASAYFILGFILIKNLQLKNLLQQPTQLKKGCLLFGSITGIGFLCWWAGANTFVMMALINLCKAFFYICLFSLLCLRFQNNWIVQGISQYGRLSLTNYLSQSFIGLFLIPNLLPNQHFLLLVIFYAIIVVILQIIFSNVWLSKFRYGPIEWFWRWGTHQKRPTFLRFTK